MVGINIPELWNYQRELVYAPERFLYVKGGRRSGKSRACMYRQGIFACQNPGSLNWTVERTWRWAGAWFRWAKSQLLPREAVDLKNSSISDLRLQLVNGAIWEFRSVDKPDSLRGGEGLHSLVGHEAAFWNREAWDTVRPTLTDKKGWAVLNSTPKGLQNWFAYDWTTAFQFVNEGTVPWEATRRAFHWPTLLNPNISKYDVEDARRQMPDAMFRQEYLGEFVSDAGSLFHLNPNCWTGKFELPDPRGRYVAGFDLAKRRDWTAWGILRIDCLPWRLVNFGRMQQVEYVAQAAILEAKFKQYGVKLAHCDMYQETVIELLKNRGLNVVGFPLTGASRPTILTNLSVILEQGEMRMPGDSANADQKREVDVLRGEFENFTPQVSKKGSVRYEAAPGYNDDYIFMLAMAAEAAKSPMSSGQGGGFLAVGGRGGGRVIR